MDRPDIRTPDFYRYEWCGLSSAALAGHFVEMRWPDEVELNCYSLWLLENTLGTDPVTREMTLDPRALPDPDVLVGASVGAHGELVLRWSDGELSAVHPGWLRHIAEGLHGSGAYLPEPVRWTADDFTEPPTVDGSQVLEDLDVLRDWLEIVVRYGLGRLQNTSVDERFMAQLAAQIGPVRGSNFGDIFSVRTVAEPDSTANTGLGLGQHADLPTRETPPGFQFLHCVENTVGGGWSRMTDGFSVVERLERDHPADYDALTTLRWVFFNRSTGDDHRWVGPVIDHIGPGHPLTLRAFYPVRAFPAMAPADVPRAYASMRRFADVAHEPGLQLHYRLAPGDLVGFDNRRVLHGRDPFEPGAGARHLRGCYIDRDDVLSRLRVLNRRREQDKLPEGGEP